MYSKHVISAEFGIDLGENIVQLQWRIARNAAHYDHGKDVM
jgi:hypothetical protein